ncbi:MAG: M1 family metallopeptidase [Bacteroidota bacterium]|nr:M1 family metallopeptidase [Bacteroidota bacterium]MDE2835490.1 M1 family metallopeptidase [Bacteroidota bacterium]
MRYLLRLRLTLFTASLAYLCSSASAQPARPGPVEDGYPKNWDIDMLHYAFALQLSDDSDVIYGQTTAEARFLEAGQSALRLDLIGVSDELEGKGMTISRVHEEGADRMFRHEDNQLFIALGREIPAQGVVRVTIEYHGVPATGLQIAPTKHGDRSFFSDNWSSRAKNWLPTVDHPYDKATNEFIVTAPNHYQVISNGLLMEETDLGAGMRLTHWKNSVPIATWLYVLGVAEFAVQYVDTFEGKSIQTWVYKQDRDAGFYDFAIPTKQALTWLSDLVGPFSYEKLANIQSNSVGGGMEAASAIFYGDRSVTGTRDRRWQHIIVHEIAHQWFGNAVTEYEWNDLWLSEGFATYYTLLFRLYAYGRDDFVAGLKDARDRVYAYYENDYDFRIIRPHFTSLNDVSGSMIYQKGAWVLHMLRALVGEDAYNAGVRNYYAAYKDANASTADFRRHIEEVSGMTLDWFFDQWLYQGGVVHLDGHWTAQEGALTISLQQTQPRYTFRITPGLDIIYEDGSTERISMALEGDQPVTHHMPVTQAVTDVVLDPDTELLARWSFVRRP